MCGCERCIDEERAEIGVTPEDDLMGTTPRGLVKLMILCETCGNKRCPHATDHRNTCTGSNEPGQKGSSWEHYQIPPRAA